MDSDNFFGFDTSNPPDDDALEGLEDGDKYDALNNETFGSNAVDGDWEEGHEQMANLTEARRITRKQQDYHNSLKQQQEDVNLLGNFQSLSLLNYGSQDGHRMGQSSAPVNIVGYQSRPHGHHHQLGSSLLGSHDLPGSPSNSIWTPSPDFDKLQPVMRQSPSNGMNRSSLGQPPGLSHLGALPSMGMQTVKTVAEIEEEMKLQHNRPHPLGPHPIGPHAMTNHLNSADPFATRDEELKREIAWHKVNRPPHLQGMVGPTHHTQQYNLQRQGSFTGGVSNSPNQHNQFNGQFQRAYPMNQGNIQGQVPNPTYPHPYFMNNNSSKGMMNHYNPPPLPHLQPRRHVQGHENYGMYHPQHPNNFHNNHSQYPQQQQDLHYSSRNSDGRYSNSNGYDQDRKSVYHYGFKDMDKWAYDKSKSFFDHGSSNSRDDYTNHSGRIRRDSEAEWEEWHRIREEDEYCGLMTPREKGWLKNIQAMQLHSDSPYEDDYYYVMYRVKEQKKREEDVIPINGLQLWLPDRGKDGGREYEPPRLENSLGKLQVVSVYAPRKIIDLQVVHLDPSHPTTPLQRDMRKHRHLLLHIEKLYSVMMELDDLERKIRHLPDCPTRDVYRTKSQQLASKLWESITGTPERLLQLLCIRKGKSLLYRLMMWVDDSAYMKLVMTILQNMPLLTKRDVHDQYLALFWPVTDRLICSSSHKPLLEFATALLAQGGASQKGNLVSALYNKYGVSLILAMMVRGEHLLADLEGCAVWQELLTAIINALASLPDSTSKSSNDTNKSSNDLPQALPSVALAASPFRPASHLSRCTGVDSQLIRTSQERMMLLEVTHTKSTTQSPAKS